ncbi:hypothetical protein AMATHDRAFT_7895, partial [Amanita thiersii Skay4041]
MSEARTEDTSSTMNQDSSYLDDNVGRLMVSYKPPISIFQHCQHIFRSVLCLFGIMSLAKAQTLSSDLPSGHHIDIKHYLDLFQTHCLRSKLGVEEFKNRWLVTELQVFVDQKQMPPHEYLVARVIDNSQRPIPPPVYLKVHRVVPQEPVESEETNASSRAVSDVSRKLKSRPANDSVTLLTAMPVESEKDKLAAGHVEGIQDINLLLLDLICLA